MYPVRLGYDVAKKRIQRLLKNGHQAEALVASVATVEKTLRRTLTQIIISAGFTRSDAEQLVNQMNGLQRIKDQWKLYDPQNRGLVVDIIGNDNWQIIDNASKKRNEIIHGKKVHKKSDCREITTQVLEALDKIVQKLDDVYMYNGWKDIKTRDKSHLHLDPKIKMPE